MSKQFKIKEQDYYSKDDIQIEISEEISTPVEMRKTFVSVSNLKQTIAFLKEKKKKTVSEIEAEIQENQDVLDKMKLKIDEIQVKEKINVLNNL
jgi:hypothetical protein